MLQKYRITGMSCSACSSSVERTVSHLDGVASAQVNLLANTMLCEYDENILDDNTIIKAIEGIGFGAAVYVPHSEIPQEKEKYTPIKPRLIISIVFLCILMYVSMGHMAGLPLPHFLHGTENAFWFALIQLILTLPVIYVNRKFYFNGYRSLFKRSPNMDTLVAVGSSAALIYGIAATVIIGIGSFGGNTALTEKYASNLYFESAAMILTLVTVGKYLESRSKSKTGSAIAKLIDLAPKTAIVLKDGVQKTVPVEDIVKGDIIVIKPGTSIPVDGIVIDGNSTVDESALTGESIPVEKSSGSRVLSASINKNGSFTMKAEKVGFETTLSKIIDLVENASATKAPIAGLADKIAGIFVPVVMSISLITLVGWLLGGYGLEFALNCAISVLVISCPCALGLATPVAITVSIGRCASKGILIKSAEAIENLEKSTTIVLDKTGTVTNGDPEVTDAISFGIEKNELLSIAASLEKNSEHPLADAICEYAKDNSISLYDISGFKSETGKGISADINGKYYFGGNSKYMSALGIDISAHNSTVKTLSESGKTVMFFAEEDSLIGIIAAADTIKPTSRNAVSKLREMGLEVIMLTGDNEVTAKAIAKSAGIDKVIAGVLPDGKDSEILRLQQQGEKVIMVGDGINDSPALVRADTGIAIGDGTDIAIDSADVVLMNSDLENVPEAVLFSKRTIKNIKENLFWAFFYNVICIPVAAGVLYPALGVSLSPMIGAAAMSLSSLFVVGNALRLYRK